MFKLIPIAGFALSLAGCAQPATPAKTAQPEQATPAKQYAACPEQRPSVCTRIYQPVCASRDTGIRCITTPCPAAELQTYSNACEACSDAKVSGYTLGNCPK